MGGGSALSDAEAATNKAILEYLHRKGYRNAEQALLRQDLAAAASTPSPDSAPPPDDLDADADELSRVLLLLPRPGGPAAAGALRPGTPPGGGGGAAGGSPGGATASAAAAAALDADVRAYTTAYRELRDWVDGSLDIYKGELHAVLYPLLVHTFLELVARGAGRAARELLSAAAEADFPAPPPGGGGWGGGGCGGDGPAPVEPRA